MKAAILVKQRKPLVIADVEIPRLVFGQVLVRVVASGICGSQLGEIDGVKGPDKFLPHLLGHEGGGVVVEVGPGVTRVKKNDHVVLHWRKGFGKEAPPAQYRWGNRSVNAGWVTTFNEYAVVCENRVTPIPKDIDFSIAALLGCAVTTGMGVVHNEAKLKSGESIIVFGVGGVGLNIIQGAALRSAYPIIAVDLNNYKLNFARKFGATHLMKGSTEQIKKKVLQITGSQGVNVAIDNTGHTKVIELAYELTSSLGRTILVGVPQKGRKVRIYTLPLHFGKVLTGSCGGGCNPSVDIPEYIRLYRLRKLALDKMITHYFKLDQINNAIGKLRSGRTGRCIIKLA